MIEEARLIFLCAALSSVLSVADGTMCYVSGSHYKECSNGCCGTVPYEECCEDQMGLIIGLVVAGMGVVVVLVVVFWCYVHHKSNQVVRLAESAKSRQSANITILHMSSDNPYQPVRQQTYMNNMMGPNQPFEQNELHPGFATVGYPPNNGQAGALPSKPSTLNPSALPSAETGPLPPKESALSKEKTAMNSFRGPPEEASASKKEKTAANAFKRPAMDADHWQREKTAVNFASAPPETNALTPKPAAATAFGAPLPELGAVPPKLKLPPIRNEPKPAPVNRGDMDLEEFE